MRLIEIKAQLVERLKKIMLQNIKRTLLLSLFFLGERIIDKIKGFNSISSVELFSCIRDT